MAPLNGPSKAGVGLPSLLLLPPPPHPPDKAALKAAYEPPLHAAISRLKDEEHGEAGQVLIVGLVYPLLIGSSPRSKRLSWPEAQSILAGLYAIVSVICARLSVPIHMHAGPTSVDVRVVLIHHDWTRRVSPYSEPAIDTNNTIVPDLPTFAAAYHPWRYVFHVNNEPGLQIFSAYLKLVDGAQVLKQDQLVLVDGGLAFNVESRDSSQDSAAPQTALFRTVCLGGTFDHFHPGHKLLLTAAVLLLRVPEPNSSKPCRFIIGITGDELLKRKKHAEFVQSWEERARNTIEFLASVLQLSRGGWRDIGSPGPVKKEEGELVTRFRDDTIEIRCVVIQDAFGPTITCEDMDVLVVSGETRSGGKAVNDRRRELDWRELETFEVDVLDAEEVVDTPTDKQNFDTKISSTAIRKKKAESRI